MLFARFEKTYAPHPLSFDENIERQIADLQARQQPRFLGVAECLAAEAVLNGLLYRPALSDVKH